MLFNNACHGQVLLLDICAMWVASSRCFLAQWSEGKTKADPSFEGLELNSARPPPPPCVFRTQYHVTTSLSTGGGPLSCVHFV